MKKLLIIACVLMSIFYSKEVNAQFELAVGYGTKQILKFDVNYILRNNMVYGGSIGFKVPTGIKGKVCSTVAWNEFPNNIIGEGTINTVLNGFVGYKLNSFIIGGILGIEHEIKYKNNYDNTKTLGDNGVYSLTHAGTYGGNIGLLVKKKFNNLSISSYYATSEGVGFSFGYYF